VKSVFIVFPSSSLIIIVLGASIDRHEGGIDLNNKFLSSINATEVLQSNSRLNSDLGSEDTDRFSSEIDLN